MRRLRWSASAIAMPGCDAKCMGTQLSRYSHEIRFWPCRLFQLFKQGVDPLSVSAGLYFSSRFNVTSSLQQQHSLNNNNLPLWKRSTPSLWWNKHLSQPLCGA